MYDVFNTYLQSVGNYLRGTQSLAHPWCNGWSIWYPRSAVFLKTILAQNFQEKNLLLRIFNEKGLAIWCYTCISKFWKNYLDAFCQKTPINCAILLSKKSFTGGWKNLCSLPISNGWPLVVFYSLKIIGSDHSCGLVLLKFKHTSNPICVYDFYPSVCIDSIMDPNQCI